MIYQFSLQAVGVTVGTAMILSHGIGLLQPESSCKFFSTFPRNKLAGWVLASIAALWSLWLMATMDLGEFSRLRQFLVIMVPVTWFLTIRFVDEFLAVRALGFIALLAAAPLLDAAFLQPPVSRLLLVVLAYVWATKGLFWVGMPYLMRDQINWAVKETKRWRIMMSAGVAYGVAVLVCALFFWG